MTDLVLSEDRKQYQELAREFAQNEIAPKAHDLDHNRQFPMDILKNAWEIGLINVRLPEDMGGLGLSIGDAAVIAEELGAACAGISAAILGNDLAVAALLTANDKEQLTRWVQPLTQEFALASYCFASGKHKDKNAEGVTYKVVADEFILSGSSACINANHGQWTFVVASNALDSLQTTAFIVPINTTGFSAGEKLPALGIKCADLSYARFKEVKLTAHNVIGRAGKADQLVSQTAALTDPLLASYAIGIGRCALENSVRYAKERYTMGQPIANHQAVGFMLADMAKDVQAARLMTHKAAWLADSGHPESIASLMCKSFAVEMCLKAAIDAVQVYGGYGYSREYPVEKLMRDSKMLQLLIGGADEAHLQTGKSLVNASQA